MTWNPFKLRRIVLAQARELKNSEFLGSVLADVRDERDAQREMSHSAQLRATELERDLARAKAEAARLRLKIGKQARHIETLEQRDREGQP